MDLNLSKSVMDLMFWGRLFHNFGAIFPKALSPNVLVFTRISQRRFFDCDRRFRLGWYCLISSLIIHCRKNVLYNNVNCALCHASTQEIEDKCSIWLHVVIFHSLSVGPAWVYILYRDYQGRKQESNKWLIWYHLYKHLVHFIHM